MPWGFKCTWNSRSTSKSKVTRDSDSILAWPEQSQDLTLRWLEMVLSPVLTPTLSLSRWSQSHSLDLAAELQFPAISSPLNPLQVPRVPLRLPVSQHSLLSPSSVQMTVLGTGQGAGARVWPGCTEYPGEMTSWALPPPSIFRHRFPPSPTQLLSLEFETVATGANFLLLTRTEERQVKKLERMLFSWGATAG